MIDKLNQSEREKLSKPTEQKRALIDAALSRLYFFRIMTLWCCIDGKEIG
jgi:hypothetical protein